MSDVVDRLRSAFKAWGLRSLGDEAADEIERLTQRIEDLQAELDNDGSHIHSIKEGMRQVKDALGIPLTTPWPEFIGHVRRMAEIVSIASATCGKSNCNCVGAKRVRDAAEGVRDNR